MAVREMTTAFFALATAFVITAAAAPGFIPLLRKMKFGQEVRDDGPQSHLKKQGTPTMGGVIFVSAAAIASAAAMLKNGTADKTALQILFLMLGFGLAGFLDDYLKIKRHSSDGLKPKQKLLLQLVITLVFSLWVYYGDTPGNAGRLLIPFTGIGDNAAVLRLPVYLYVPFAVFVILGTDNGVNFTDGLDGLCSSVTSVTAAFFLIVGIITSDSGLSLVSASMIGGLLGFLLFNVYPAKVFMGDTGSLALGGFVAAAAMTQGMALYIPVIGLIYLAEVLSVIIQVGYFKATHGRRFFKMAPVHHHFELLGNSETRIVAAFTIITILLCSGALIGVVCI
ncbi:MAG: phospho-N-acetylmuramoyl-pentapeptide-transferase [Eubacteriales bacterium]|nr:phospho-N-acetylmuramoyl-pentapeptide-transferase [Eubacteriales bacterium]